MTRQDLISRVQEYARRQGLVLGKELGSGVHGIVFAAKNQIKGNHSAVKVHERDMFYCRERDVYLRLQDQGVTQVYGCNVPEMIAFDDHLLVIEMTIVERPFVLDFAGAYLDWTPDFSEEVFAEWQAEKQEQFGPRWADVQAILGYLEGLGVSMVDVNPGNVAFDD